MKLPTAATLHARIPDVNDGIIATAGVVEGFLVAGAGTDALLAATIAATIAGGLSLGGVNFSEAAAERDAELAVIAEERRTIELSPDAELRELVEHFEDLGVESTLAEEVARQVTAHDALAAQLEVEHGIRDQKPRREPFVIALLSVVGFFLGGALPIAIVLLTPPDYRAVATILAVLISLTLTGIVTAKLGRASVWRTILRSLVVGALALLISLLVGSLLPDPDGHSTTGGYSASNLEA